MVSEFRLDNGLRVILAPNKNSNQVFMSTTYLTGSLNDPQGKSGLAHLLEHLAFKGTKEVDEKSFIQRLQKNTLYQNAYTNFDRTSYINRIQPNLQAINEVLYLEAQRMGALELKAHYVPTEISIVRREREGRLDNPSVLLMDTIYEKLYGNQYYGRSIIGDLKDIQSITQKDLKDFYQTWYVPNNAVIILTGNFDQKQVIESIDKNFSAIAQKPLPVIAQIPKLDLSTLQQDKFKNIVVEKGSNYVKNNIYVSNSTAEQNLLSAIGLLYTLKPNGLLYKNVEEKGIATSVGIKSFSNKDLTLGFVSALYAPNHDEKKVLDSLTHTIEQPAQFNASDVDRVKKIITNGIKSIEVSPQSFQSVLQEYIVQYGDWQPYFVDKKQLQAWTANDLNTLADRFFVPSHRITATIKPSQNVAGGVPSLDTQTPNASSDPSTSDEHDEALKTPEEYQKETQQYVSTSKTKLTHIEKMIQRGQLSDGVRYALYPTQTFDKKIYATINMHFGTPETLKNQSINLAMLSDLLFKGSRGYTRQQIMDQSIALDGQASVDVMDNGLQITISADQTHFIEYFKYIMNVLKQPLFPQSEFDLIQQQYLSSLNRPYTEPDVVADITLDRLIEIYQPGDLRYHFEPDLQKQQIQAATRADVVALYQKFFAFNQSEIAVTGDYDAKHMKTLLQNTFGTWKNKQPYALMATQYTRFPAKQVHALAEKTAAGTYLGVLHVPVGASDEDTEALYIVGEILNGSQQTSRLSKALRENKQLVYGVSASFNLDPQSHAGLLGINAKYQSGYATQVSKTVHDVLTELVANGVTTRELELAKLKIMKIRSNSLDDSRRIHQTLDSMLEMNKTMADRIRRDEKIQSLTKAEVDAVIKKYIDLNQLIEVSADEYGKTKTL